MCRAGDVDGAWSLWKSMILQSVHVIDSSLCAAAIFEFNLALRPRHAQAIVEWMHARGLTVDQRVKDALAMPAPALSTIAL